MENKLHLDRIVTRYKRLSQSFFSRSNLNVSTSFSIQYSYPDFIDPLRLLFSPAILLVELFISLFDCSNHLGEIGIKWSYYAKVSVTFSHFLYKWSSSSTKQSEATKNMSAKIMLLIPFNL